MEITEWSPGQRMGVRHSGLVAGEGAFTLVKVEGGEDEGGDRETAGQGDEQAASTAHTYFQWEEKLRFPWRLGGPVTALAAWPVLRSMWKGNLLRLKARIENS